MIDTNRRRRDRLVAALIAVVVLALAVVVYVTSDIRQVTRDVAAAQDAPALLDTAPTELTEVWALDAPAEFPAVVSPYGVVVTGDSHTVTAFSADTGQQRWSYSRANLPLCALASGDTRPEELNQSSAVRGILTGYAKSGHCSEITLLNPITGALYQTGSEDKPANNPRQRNSPMQLRSSVVFGGPYAAMVGDTLLESWRFDLVRTIQYGDQPTPTKANTKHLGCTFDDMAITDKQFATIEHCAETGDSAQLVVQHADPDNTTRGKKDGWDVFKFEPRGTVDLQVTQARIVGITETEIAVVVGGDTPELVVYGMVKPPAEPAEPTDGAETTAATEAEEPEPVLTELRRTAVDLTAEQIAKSAAASRITPVTIADNGRYAVVDGVLVATYGSELSESWTLRGVLGRVAQVGGELLVPVEDGVAVVATSDGSIQRMITVDRGGYTGPVDLGLSGSTVVEVRGTRVVGLTG